MTWPLVTLLLGAFGFSLAAWVAWQLLGAARFATKADLARIDEALAFHLKSSNEFAETVRDLAARPFDLEGVKTELANIRARLGLKGK